MKILLISKWVAGATPGDFFYPGVWRDTYELALQFKSEGHRVAILTPKVHIEHISRFEREFLSALNRRKISYYQASSSIAFANDWGIFRWKMFFAELKTISLFKPDVIQYMEFSPTLLYPFIGKRKLFFYSCYFSKSYPDENTDKLAKQNDWVLSKSIFNIFLNASYLLINKIIGSNDIKKISDKGGVLILMHKKGFRLVKSLLKQNKNVFYIQKGIKQESISRGPKINKNTILFIGSILYGKGIFDLLEAFSQGIKKIPDVQLLIAGSGPKTLVRKLKDTIKIKKLRATYVGSVNYNDKWNLYKKSSVFCLPSYRDAYPSVILEAQVLGLPIITTYEIDSPVVEGKTGIKVHAGDIKGLSNALINLISDKKLRQKMKNEALINSKLYLWDKSVKKLLMLYHKYKINEK